MTSQGRKLTPAEIQEQLAGNSNFSANIQEGQSPMRDFSGNLVDIEAEQVTGERGVFLRIGFIFDKLDVRDCVGVYSDPTHTLKFSYNDTTKPPSAISPLGMFVKDVPKILGTGGGTNNIFSMKGMRLDIKYTAGHETRRAPAEGETEWKTVEISAFQIVGLNGKGLGATTSSTPSIAVPANAVVVDDILVDLADSHTVAEFTNESLRNPAVVKDTSMFSTLSATPEAVLQRLEDEGRLTKAEDGTYRKV
jgi:hypothetical protein